MSLILKVQREVNLSLHHKREMQKEKLGLIQLCFDIFLLSVTFYVILKVTVILLLYEMHIQS